MNMLADVSGGSKFENSIFVQLHQKGALCYYSLKNGKEIDFILEKKIAFEAKESPYTAKEWAKIEKLAASEGKTYKSIQEAKKHIQSL